MKPRSSVPAAERRVRSRLAQLAHEGEVLRGTLTLMRHTCGKRGCRCARGEKHESWYLAYSEEGKKRMVSIPRDALAGVREWVARYREAKGCLETLSEAALARLRESKGGRGS
jgi:hypothetical protein